MNCFTCLNMCLIWVLKSYFTQGTSNGTINSASLILAI